MDDQFLPKDATSSWNLMMDVLYMAIESFDDAEAAVFIGAVVVEYQAKMAELLGEFNRPPLEYREVLDLPTGTPVDIIWPERDEGPHRYQIVRMNSGQVYAVSAMEGLKGFLDPTKCLSARWSNQPRVWLTRPLYLPEHNMTFGIDF